MIDFTDIKAIATIIAIIGHIVVFYGLYSNQKHDLITYSIIAIGLSMVLIPLGICANVHTIARIIAIVIGILVLLAAIASMLAYNMLIKKDAKRSDTDDINK